MNVREDEDFDDHSVSPCGRLWRFAPAVLGLLDLARPKTKGMKRDELTYTSIKGGAYRCHMASFFGET
jgi:hypothetical protein